MTTHEFEISARDLDAAGKSFQFPIRAAWLRGVLEGNEATTAGPDGQLEVRASKSGNDVVIRGSMKAELSVPCARCLTSVPVHIDQEISTMYVPASAVKGSKGMDDEYEFAPEEADLQAFDGDLVVMDDYVRDELLLEIPMIPLCSEDCAGMSPSPEEGRATAHKSGQLSNSSSGSGEDEARIDPRLMPLLRLKKQNERKKE